MYFLGTPAKKGITYCRGTPGTHVVWKLHSFSFVGNKKNDYEHVGMPGGSWRMRVMRLGSISLAAGKGTIRLVTGYVGKDPTTLR